jgi:hypothetical protein
MPSAQQIEFSGGQFWSNQGDVHTPLGVRASAAVGRFSLHIEQLRDQQSRGAVYCGVMSPPGADCSAQSSDRRRVPRLRAAVCCRFREHLTLGWFGVPLLKLRSAITLIVVLTAAACASTRHADGREEFRGIFSHGFEADAFKPCGSPETWWALLPASAIDKYNQIARPYQPVLIRGVGKTTDYGPSGHMGRYHRYLVVDYVFEMALTGAVRC